MNPNEDVLEIRIRFHRAENPMLFRAISDFDAAPGLRTRNLFVRQLMEMGLIVMEERMRRQDDGLSTRVSGGVVDQVTGPASAIQRSSASVQSDVPRPHPPSAPGDALVTAPAAAQTHTAGSAEALAQDSSSQPTLAAHQAESAARRPVTPVPPPAAGDDDRPPPRVPGFNGRRMLAVSRSNDRRGGLRDEQLLLTAVSTSWVAKSTVSVCMAVNRTAAYPGKHQSGGTLTRRFGCAQLALTGVSTSWVTPRNFRQSFADGKPVGGNSAPRDGLLRLTSVSCSRMRRERHLQTTAQEVKNAMQLVLTAVSTSCAHGPFSGPFWEVFPRPLADISHLGGIRAGRGARGAHWDWNRTPWTKRPPPA